MTRKFSSIFRRCDFLLVPIFSSDYSFNWTDFGDFFFGLIGAVFMLNPFLYTDVWKLCPFFSDSSNAYAWGFLCPSLCWNMMLEWMN